MRKDAEIVFEKSARAIWSNVNNGAMHNFVNLIANHREEFMAEKDMYIDLLRRRSEIFARESAQCGLPLYPYTEGFFMTVKVDNSVVFTDKTGTSDSQGVVGWTQKSFSVGSGTHTIRFNYHHPGEGFAAGGNGIRLDTMTVTYK